MSPETLICTQGTAQSPCPGGSSAAGDLRQSLGGWESRVGWLGPGSPWARQGAKGSSRTLCPGQEVFRDAAEPSRLCTSPWKPYFVAASPARAASSREPAAVDSSLLPSAALRAALPWPPAPALLLTQTRPRATLLLHLPPQGAEMCQALAVVTPGHMAHHRRSHGCSGSKLPAVWGVLAQHSSRESSDDPGRAAMGRCQTLALEHPLASHQPWPRHSAGASSVRATHGWGWSSWMWDPVSAIQPCPPCQCTILGSLKVPTSLVGSAHPMALMATSREQLQPHQLVEGDGCQRHRLGNDGVCGWQRAESRCSPEGLGSLSQHLTSGNGSALL